MYTLFGPEAKDGDYVLVQDAKFMGGADKIYIAQVKGDKAYAAATIRNSNGFKWLRKETAITIFPESEVSDLVKKVIQMNLDSQKASFVSPSDYSKQVFQMIADASTEATEKRVATYGETYRYR